MTSIPEIMSIIDFVPFVKNITTYWAKIFICRHIKNDKEARVSICLFLFLVIIIYPVISRVLLSIIGFLISYQIYYKYGAVQTGDLSFGMLKFDGIHIHHWMYCTILCIICVMLGSYPLLIGLCFGGITHGIQFSDWYMWNSHIQTTTHTSLTDTNEVKLL